MYQHKCEECGRWLEMEEIGYGHDCEVQYEKEEDDE
jgi:hypothetical protein